MKILYTRVSSAEQKTDRQRINEHEFDEVIEDKVSGTLPFFDRNGGLQIKKYLDEGILDSVAVWEIDRLGRSLKDILDTIHVFNQRCVPIRFLNQNLSTINEDGTQNHVSNLIISILATVAEMEKNQIRERQLEGIKIAKLKGKYSGRKKGSSEDVLTFLGKPQNQKALKYLKMGMSLREVSKLAGIHYNTVGKIKKLGIAV